MKGPCSLTIWTVYDSPSDAPGLFMARRFEVTRTGAHATSETMTSTDLYDIRVELARRGMVPLQRDPQDDPAIVETWV